jgi:CBS domain-containing protein
MSRSSVSEAIIREVPLLREDEPVAVALRGLLASGLPALPVLDAAGRYAGIFGEREFLAALFPGYLGELRSAGFVPRRIEHALAKRAGAADEAVGRYLNREHVEVGAEPSDAQVAEIFLHHRVLVVPVVEGGRVLGLLTRRDFVATLAERLLAR